MSHEEGGNINYCNVETNFEQIRHGLIQKVFESKTSSRRYGVSLTDPPSETLFNNFPSLPNAMLMTSILYKTMNQMISA